MMQFADSETQRLLRTTARSYLANAYPWERLFRIESGVEEVGGADIDEIAALGWLNLLSSDADGASLLEAAVVIEEFGYAGVSSPVAACNAAAYVLSKARSAPPARNGIVTISEASPAGSTLTFIGTTVSGTLHHVPFAGMSSHVLARTTSGGIPTLALVPLSGAQIEPLSLLDGRSHSNVTFADSPAAAVASGSEADSLGEQLSALSTAFAVIQMAGMIQRVLELTTEHVTTRQQFGQPIGKFQAARHRAADILVQLDTTRWAAYHALWQFERDPSNAQDIFLAKHWAVRAVDRVFQNAHMLHGGVGVGMDHPLHLFTQSLHALAVRGCTMNEIVSRAGVRNERVAYQTGGGR
jgi:alkylation response protein AidB-like acyl-CoA dehydrogenase